MPFDYVIHKERRLVISTGSGLVTWQEIKARQDQTRTDPDFNPEYDQIVDLRSVTGFDMSTEQTRMLARRQIFSSKSKRAFIATSPSVFGMGRMWETYTEFSENPSQIKVFYDVASALRWLGVDSSLLPSVNERNRR
jgi:hypothetical protein